MPRGDQREDGFVYLSDPFIRRLVGPEVKLTEAPPHGLLQPPADDRPRGHALPHAVRPASPSRSPRLELDARGCAPDVLHRACTAGRGGQDVAALALAAASIASRTTAPPASARTTATPGNGPLPGNPPGQVTAEEAGEYRQFVEEYGHYWRRYFDPIAIRDPDGAEAVPRGDDHPAADRQLGLHRPGGVLGGEPEPLDALPVPKRNIFSVAVRLNKERLPKADRHPTRAFMLSAPARCRPSRSIAGVPRPGHRQPGGAAHLRRLAVFRFQTCRASSASRWARSADGAASHDESPMWRLPRRVAQHARSTSPCPSRTPGWSTSSSTSWITLAAVAAAARGKRFLRHCAISTRSRWAGRRADGAIRCRHRSGEHRQVADVLARIDNGLYIASKRFILEDLAAKCEAGEAHAAHGRRAPSPTAWSASGPSIGRKSARFPARLGGEHPPGLSEQPGAAELGGPGDGRRRHEGRRPRRSTAAAADLHAVHFFCPDGGQYVVAPDGKQVTCSVHGSAMRPSSCRPRRRQSTGRPMQEFGGTTAELDVPGRRPARGDHDRAEVTPYQGAGKKLKPREAYSRGSWRRLITDQTSQPGRYLRRTNWLISSWFVHFMAATSHSSFLPTPASIANWPVRMNSVKRPE